MSGTRSGRIEVSKDVHTLVKSWLHSSTGEHDSIKLPSPPKLTLWPDRQGLGSPRVSNIVSEGTEKQRPSLATKLKRRLLVAAKRKRESLSETTHSAASSTTTEEFGEESKNNTISSTRKRKSTNYSLINSNNNNKRRKGNSGQSAVSIHSITKGGGSLLPDKGRSHDDLYDFSGHEIKVLNRQPLLKSHIRSGRNRKKKKNFK